MCAAVPGSGLSLLQKASGSKSLAPAMFGLSGLMLDKGKKKPAAAAPAMGGA